MVSTRLIFFDVNYPKFPNPDECSFEDWAFFSRDLWTTEIELAILHIGWSNNYNMKSGHYICKLIVNKDWANPVETVETRDPLEVEYWLKERAAYLTEDYEYTSESEAKIDADRYPGLYEMLSPPLSRRTLLGS
jgi:hypothetical protein